MRNEDPDRPASDLLSVAQVAELLSVGPSVVRGLLSTGALPGRRVDGQWWVVAEDFEAWLLAQYVATRAEVERSRHRGDASPTAWLQSDGAAAAVRARWKRP